jgi:hypothetical protein
MEDIISDGWKVGRSSVFTNPSKLERLKASTSTKDMNK